MSLRNTLLRFTSEIQYMFSSAPLDRISSFSEPFRVAIQNSHLWKSERERRELSSGCVTVMIPSDPEQDTSINILVGYDDGFRLREMFGLQQVRIE